MPTTSKARRCTFIIAPGDLKRWHGGTQDLPESLAESPGGRSAKGLHPNLLSPFECPAKHGSQRWERSSLAGGWQRVLDLVLTITGALWRHPSRSENRANTITQRYLSDPSRSGP